MNTVEMAHGSGGQAMQQLINRLFMEAFNNPWLAEQEDQARIEKYRKALEYIESASASLLRTVLHA